MGKRWAIALLGWGWVGCPGAPLAESHGGDAGPSDAPARDAATPADRFEPMRCGPATPAYDGDLCGTAALPCRVLADEVVTTDPAYGADLLVDDDGTVHVVAARVETAVHAIRDAAGSWRSEPFPAAIVGAGVARLPGGGLFVLAGDVMGGGSRAGMSMWERRAETWRAAGTLEDVGNVPPDVVQSDDGCVHGDFQHLSATGAATPVHGLFDGSRWTLTPLPRREGLPIGSGVALAPDGAAHVAWWVWAEGMNTLYWVAAGGEAEVIASEVTDGLAGDPLPMAVVPEDGGVRIHVVTRRATREPPANRIVDTTRSPDGVWTDVPIDDGEVYDLDVAVTSGSGDVRVFYAAWVGMAAEVRMAAIRGERVEVARLPLPASEAHVPRVRAAVDGRGRIHVIGTRATTELSETRYLLLGP